MPVIGLPSTLTYPANSIMEMYKTPQVATMVTGGSGRGAGRGGGRGGRGRKEGRGNSDQERSNTPTVARQFMSQANCYREIAELKAEKEAQDVDANKKKQTLANHHA